MTDPITRPLSRRGFLGLAGAAAATPVLAACGGSSGSGGSSGTLKFWDMPWGTADYNTASKNIVSGYKPAANQGGAASYQTIQWANFNQTFSSAIASGTGPAVSTGGGFQAFRLAQEGAIAYADDFIASIKKSGFYDDFLAGTIDGMKTDQGYVAIPWQLDCHAFWYNKGLLSQVGVDVPTSWDEIKSAGLALKKAGFVGFATGAGNGNSLGYETPMSLMVGNGGGLFAPDGTLDVMNARNVEAMEFFKELQSAGIIDPASIAYTNHNSYNQWKQKKFAMGFEQAGLADNVGGDVGDDLTVADPIPGPHGDQKALVVQNNVMMYKKTPSQAGSEALLETWLKGMHVFWDRNLVNALPVLKSIVNSASFQKKSNYVAMVKKYQPIGISYCARGTTLSVSQSKIDGATPMFQFGQAMLSPNTSAQTALTNLSNALASVEK